MCFNKYPRCAVIIGCFEIQLEKASAQTANSQTLSRYKARNTLKYLIGIAALGMITFILKGWGGCTSNKHITEHSKFLQNFLPGDVDLADGGFNVEDSVALQGAPLKFMPSRKANVKLDK